MSKKKKKPSSDRRNTPTFDFFQIVDTFCQPFPQENERYLVANEAAPFTSAGDQIISDREVYVYDEENELCTDKVFGRNLLVCTIVGTPTPQDPVPLALCDSSLILSSTGETILGKVGLPLIPVNEYQASIVGGTGQFAGVTGKYEYTVVRTDMANDVGFDIVRTMVAEAW